MSTHIVGFRPADEQWNKMKHIWDACEAAGVPIPAKVEKFFDSEPPGDKPGQEVTLGKAAKNWSDDSREGFELDITKLPPDVKIVRFYNSW